MQTLKNNTRQYQCNNLESSHIQATSENDNTQEEYEDNVPVDTQQLENRYHDGSGDIKVLVLYTSAAENSVSNIYNTALLAEEESVLTEKSNHRR